MDLRELGDCVKRVPVSSGPASLFHHPDPTFDLRYVLVGTYQGLERCEFVVSVYRRDVETTL
jgi:homogentisate 1,2-dioxygenase